MSVEKAWKNMIDGLMGKKLEFPTAPKTRKTPVWFLASTDGDKIYINEAVDHQPSSKLSMERTLDFDTFQKVYPLYFKREDGESVSAEVTAITVNQVYYFSLIKYLAQ